MSFAGRTKHQRSAALVHNVKLLELRLLVFTGSNKGRRRHLAIRLETITTAGKSKIARPKIKFSDRMRAITGLMLHQLKRQIDSSTVYKDRFQQYKTSHLCVCLVGKVFFSNYIAV